MNIGLHIDSRVVPAFGGGYTYVEKIIELLSKNNGCDDINYVIVHEKYVNDEECGERGAVTLEKFRFKAPKNRSLFSHSQKQSDVDNEYRRYVSEALSKNNISLVYHPHQHRCVSIDVPYIVTNWDLAHITTYAFPELSGKHFDTRKNWYDEYIHRALLVFAESHAGKRELVEYLKIPESKIKVIPMFPGKVVDVDVEENQQQEILEKHNIQKDQYFFYPSQFWAVKNHYNLLRAFRFLLDESPKNVKLVFTGVDKGNLDYIKGVVERLDLTGKVLFLGFVDVEVLNTLYKNAISLVFPTLLGPTNMPIVEALSLGCPVICSNFDGHKEQAENAALYVDPMDASDISKKMKLVYLDEGLRSEMIEKGLLFVQSSEYSVGKTAEKLHECFLTAKQIMNLWK